MSQDVFSQVYDIQQQRKTEREVDVTFGNNDMTVAPVVYEGQLFYPQGDAPKKDYGGDFVEAGKDLVSSLGTMAAGGASAVAGAPVDLVGLLAGIGSAIFPGDKGRAEAFADTFTKFSEFAGSEALLNPLRDAINNSDMSGEDKQQQLDILEQSSIVGLPGVVPASKSAVKGVKSYIDTAPDRVAERATGTTLTTNVDPTVLLDEAIVAMGKQAKPDIQDLKTVLDARASQMDLPMAKRTQPSDDQLFELDYLKTTGEQIEIPVPRAPEGKPLPKFNRASKVQEMTEQIATVLAERAKPFIGSNVQFFYHTGPIIDKAIELGVPEDVARKQLRKFAENYAATSPRTKTDANVRSATLVSAKQNVGLELSDIVGVGSGGLNEKGYPMMIGPGGIHQQLVDDVAAGGFNFNKNPKPATFVENVSGNLSGVTADTHAIRAVFDAMNEIEPGSVPLQFIGGRTPKETKEFQEAYQKDPSSLNVANMIADRLASQKIDGESVQTEYAVFSDIYKLVAEKIGVQPAEAQSLSWFANGSKTGLGSAPKTIVELVNERIDVTAQVLNKPKEEVFVKFLQGSIPLLSLGGLTLLDTGAIVQQEEQTDGT